MKISVAMATYNGGRYLREQLDSIARQTLLPAELIICDDGSSDDTLEVARRFAAEAPFPVHVDAHGQRLGFTKNFLRALDHCTGEVVALCDQDDVWYDTKLAVGTAPFADEAVVTVTHRAQVVDQHLRPTPLVIPAHAPRGKFTLFNLDPWFAPNGMQLLFRRARIMPWLRGAPAPLSTYGYGTAPFDEWIFNVGTLAGSAVVLRDILGLWRRHDAVTTIDVANIARDNSASHKLHLALHSGGESYAFRAQITDTRAEVAARTVPGLDGGTVAAIPGAEAYYRHMSRMFRRRVRLHDPKSNRLQRLALFGGMAARLDYRPRSRGGLGAKAILKDGFTIFFGPRATL